MAGKSILVEQVVYGSFAFSDRGYSVLGRSPGVSEKTLSDLLVACCRFGEAPRGATAAASLFSLRLPDGPQAVVGVFPQGLDDRGRPGALAFHALLIAERDFRRVGSNPFLFSAELRGEWTAATTALPPLTWRVDDAIATVVTVDDPRVRGIVSALGRGRRVALESDAPIDAMARQAWNLLPEPIRSKASVATWAYGNDNRFDLVAVPRLAGIALDASYLPDGLLDDTVTAPVRPEQPPGRSHFRFSPRITIPALALGLAAVALLWPRRHDPVSTAEPSGIAKGSEIVIDPAARSRIIEALNGLAARFDVPALYEPADLMARFAAQVRYRGPFLTPSELTRLAAEVDPDRDRALAWQRRIVRFRDDRPLPDDFRDLDLARQVDAFGESYHLPGSTRPVEKTLATLDDALSRPGPIVPTPLAARYPALSDYARFLSRLPRGNEGTRP